MSTRSTTRSTVFVVGISAACVIVAAAAFWFRTPGATIRPAGRRSVAAPALSLVVSGDTSGWIVPCGCASNQSGGLPRRAAYVDSLRKEGKVIVVDVGGAPGGSSVYDRLKFEAILEGELAMGLAVHNLGAAEAALGPEALRGLASRLGVPFVSANVRDSAGELVAAPFRIVDAAERRIGFIGVLSPRFAADGVQISDPKDSILAAMQDMEELRPCDSLVILAYLPVDELRALSADMPEADVVVGGPTGQALAPERTGSRWLAAATNKGKFVVRFSVPETNTPETVAWEGKVVEMNDTFQDHSEQRRNLEKFYAVLGQRDVEASQTGFIAPIPADVPEEYRIAGTASCMRCHEGDCRSWSDSAHAHAWETLSSRGAHVDAYCQQCHTTGYGLPGGFVSVRRSGSAINVGCESCHGPSAAHVARPERKTPFVARDQCLRCHDRENSPTFEYAPYWESIRHGQPANDENPASRETSHDSEPRP